MASSTKNVDPTKLQKAPSTSPSKTIFIKTIFQDINK
jgi:hypothetical protein